jgi:hypothetical protein
MKTCYGDNDDDGYDDEDDNTDELLVFSCTERNYFNGMSISLTIQYEILN